MHDAISHIRNNPVPTLSTHKATRFWRVAFYTSVPKIRSGCDFVRLFHQALRLPTGGDEGRAGDFSRYVAHQRGAAQAQRLFMYLVAPFGPFMLEKIESVVNAVENPGAPFSREMVTGFSHLTSFSNIDCTSMLY